MQWIALEECQHIGKKTTQNEGEKVCFISHSSYMTLFIQTPTLVRTTDPIANAFQGETIG